MKTVTEFTGLEIKKLLKIQSELMKTIGTEIASSTPSENTEQAVKSEQAHATANQDKQDTPSQESAAELAPTENTEQTHDQSKDNPSTTDQDNSNNTDKQEKSTDEAAASTNETSNNALKPKRPSWKDRADALRPQLIDALKNEFAWKNEDRFNLAIDASRAVNPKLQERLRKVTALKKDKEEEKTPKFAVEVGELIFLADYLIIKQEKDDRKGRKNNAKDNKKGKKTGKKKFKHKPFNDDNGKPNKRAKKPIPNPVKSNNKTVAVEKK